eukprot:SAG11_NODE_43_length_20795_cov_11.860456_12_plen_97_part_00
MHPWMQSQHRGIQSRSYRPAHAGSYRPALCHVGWTAGDGVLYINYLPCVGLPHVDCNGRTEHLAECDDLRHRPPLAVAAHPGGFDRIDKIHHIDTV